jgi:hypothetical protein
MEHISHVLALIGKTVLFVALSIVFLPAFFIVTYLQETWSSMLSELFGY